MNAQSSTSSITHDAGCFGTWLAQARAALRGNGGMDVPCGDCTGCCTSAYSILLRPHDKALDIIPVKILSGATGLAYPHARMNPRKDGTCPMFSEGKCSIYADRPQTCLDYDCRVFAAAGIDAGADRPVISKRVSEWRFTYADDADRKAHHAVRTAATFIIEHRSQFRREFAPTTSSGIAVLALKVYKLFLDPDFEIRNESAMANSIVNASREFDAVAKL